MTLAACGGGGDDHAATETTVTGDSNDDESMKVETVAAGEDGHADEEHADEDHGDMGDEGDEGHGGTGGMVSKEAFDELKLQVLELAVEVDKLQTMLGLTTSGAEPEAADGEGESEGTPSWTYAEAERWHELGEAFSACSDGLEQSPIDLTGAAGIDLPNLVLDYAASDATIIDNGHTIQLNVPDAGTLELDGVTYAFEHFDFHSPSEHTMEGDHWPMELQFVHRADDGSMAVVGVLVEEGPELSALDVIIDSLPIERDVEDIVYGQVDLNALLPELTAGYHYHGSLTAPPCSEGVMWSVLQGTITMSAEQIAVISDRFDEENNRPTQPINDRTLEKDLSA